MLAGQQSFICAIVKHVTLLPCIEAYEICKECTYFLLRIITTDEFDMFSFEK